MIHTFRAYAFADRFPLRDLSLRLGLSQEYTGPHASLFKPIGPSGGMYVFNFPAVVFVDVTPETQKEELTSLAQSVYLDSLVPVATEDFVVDESQDFRPKVEFNRLLIDHLTRERTELVALTVSQSTIMEHFERVVDRAWDNVREMVRSLRTRGTIVTRSSKQLHRMIGEVVSLRNDALVMLHFLDRPDLTWEDKTIDSLYSDLQGVFDLSERFVALRYKLDSIQDSLEILIDTVRDRRIFAVELTIVALILFEIVMALTTRHY